MQIASNVINIFALMVTPHPNFNTNPDQGSMQVYGAPRVYGEAWLGLGLGSTVRPATATALTLTLT